MTTFSFARILTGVATAAILSTATLSGATDALAHGGMGGGGMGGGGMGGGHVGGMGMHTQNLTKITNLSRSGLRDRRRFRFIGVGYVNAASACVIKWTELGRVKICPDLD